MFFISTTPVKKYRFKSKLDLAKVADILDKNKSLTIINVTPTLIRLKFDKSSYLILLRNKINLQIRFALSFMWWVKVIVLPIFLLAIKVAFENYFSDMLNDIVSISLGLFVVGWIVYFSFFHIKRKTRDFINYFEEKIIS